MDEEQAAPAAAPLAAAGATEAGPDALATGLMVAMIVAVVVMWFAGLAGAAMVRGVVPALLQTAYDNLLICAGGALGVAVIGGGAGFLMARKGSK